MSFEPLGGGFSNTPLETNFVNNRATCIDYWKGRFDISWEKEHRRLGHLFDILHVEVSKATGISGHNGYQYGLLLAPGIEIHYGGAYTKNKNGDETCLLEIKGEGCREFEQRYYSHMLLAGVVYPRSRILVDAWAEFIKEAISLNAHCTRIDIPTDDFSGNITVDEIREKLSKGEYSTRLKRVRTVKSGDLEAIENIEDEQLSKAGYSVTLGGNKHMQLCIYDKLAERTNKGLKPDTDSWVRFEVRFFHENAEALLPQLLDALMEWRETAFIVGCLAKIITFTEDCTYGAKNNYKNKSWSKWDALLERAREPESFSASPRILSIEKNFGWAAKSTTKTYARIILATGCSPNELGTYLALLGTERLNGEDLMVINQYRDQKKLPKFSTVDDLKAAIFEKQELCVEFNPFITELATKVAKDGAS